MRDKEIEIMILTYHNQTLTKINEVMQNLLDVVDRQNVIIERLSALEE